MLFTKEQFLPNEQWLVWAFKKLFHSEFFTLPFYLGLQQEVHLTNLPIYLSFHSRMQHTC